MASDDWTLSDFKTFFVNSWLLLSTIPLDTLYSPLIPQKLQSSFNALPNPIQYPEYTNGGNWVFDKPDYWTSGFFPATLYEMNTRQTLCSDNKDVGGAGVDWVSLGRSASTGLVGLPGHNTQGHDVGFLSFPFMEELKINPQNQTAIQVVNGFAHDLASRFNPTVGATESWDSSNPDQFQVIIDNMMNLELLFVAQDLTGNTTLGDIARKHADTTMKNQFRDDGSTYHVVEYSAATGAVTAKHTAQGYADNSTWARGQAWAIYGFTNMYTRTKDSNYLDTGRKAARYFISHLPPDGVVPWDFNAPLQDPKTGGPRPADTSAATIASTGLILLSNVETDQNLAAEWTIAAIKILQGTQQVGWRPEWQSLLSNGTINWPQNNYLTGVVYGDMYFIKAGNELIKKGLATC